MRKNELVHLHALLSYVMTEFVEEGVTDAERFEAYHALGVTPMSMRAPRARHEEAVLTLARLLGEAAASVPSDNSVTADDSAGAAESSPSSSF